MKRFLYIVVTCLICLVLLGCSSNTKETTQSCIHPSTESTDSKSSENYQYWQEDPKKVDPKKVQISIKLVKAIETGDNKAVKVLVEQGADVNKRVWAQQNDTGRVWRTYKSEIEEGQFCFVTPLIVAVQSKNANLVRYLLDHGADIELHGIEGIMATSDAADQSPLHFACQGGNLAIARILVANGADVNDKNDLDYGYQDTPLMTAAESGNVELVKFLIDHGAQVNTIDNQSVDFEVFTAYTHAQNYPKIQEILKRNGAKFFENGGTMQVGFEYVEAKSTGLKGIFKSYTSVNLILKSTSSTQRINLGKYPGKPILGEAPDLKIDSIAEGNCANTKAIDQFYVLRTDQNYLSVLWRQVEKENPDNEIKWVPFKEIRSIPLDGLYTLEELD